MTGLKPMGYKKQREARNFVVAGNDRMKIKGIVKM